MFIFKIIYLSFIISDCNSDYFNLFLEFFIGLCFFVDFVEDLDVFFATHTICISQIDEEKGALDVIEGKSALFLYSEIRLFFLSHIRRVPLGIFTRQRRRARTCDERPV